MTFLYLLFACIATPGIIFSQTPVKKEIYGNKENDRETIRYYQRNTDLSRGFIKSYIKLISGHRDHIKANKLIRQLYKFNETVFYRFIRIRLEWEFKEHLMMAPLDSVKSLLKNKIDSAGYYYMLAIYFKDKMDSTIARKAGFVKGTAHYETIDWLKIKTLYWGDPKLLEMVSHSDKTIFRDDRLRDSSVFYYKKAMGCDPGEFYYLADLLYYLSNLGEEKAIQQIITSGLNNYTGKKKACLEASLARSYQKEEKN